MDLREKWIEEMDRDSVLIAARFVTDAPAQDVLDAAIARINQSHSRTQMRPEDLYIIPADMSTDDLDSHFSRMDGTSLQNYVADARAGAPFMSSHGRSLPLGHTFDGEYADTGTQRIAKAQVYMRRGSNTSGINTDDVWGDINAGVIRDCSIGFYGGQSICDVCGNDVRDYENCPHIPGTSYKTRDGVIATYTVKNAHLRELSAVYAGSTPGAMFSRSALDKTVLGIREHMIGARIAATLEEKYALTLSNERAFRSIPTYVAAKNARQGDTPDMNPKELADFLLTRGQHLLPADVRKAIQDTRGALKDGDTDLSPVLVHVERVMTLCHEQRELLSAFPEVKDMATARKLAGQAKDGEAYRTILITEALEEGTRGQGEEFDKALYEEILQGRSIEQIQAMKKGWEKLAQARLAGFNEDGTPKTTGGRQTIPATGLETFGGPKNGSAPPLTGTANNYK